MKSHWILIVCLLVVHAGCRNPTKPNGNGFDPRNISRNSGMSIAYEAIASDNSGGIHVVWQDNTGGNFEILYSTRSGNSSWTEPVNISNTNEASIAASVVSDASGRIHVLWEEDTSPYQIFYTMKADGDTWSTPESISDSGCASELPHIAVDGAGNLHAVWVGSGIWYCTKPPVGPWTSPNNILGGGENPTLAVEQNGNVHVVLEAAGNNEIYYTFKPLGDTWSDPVNVSNMPGYSWIPHVAVDSQGNIYVTWSEAWAGSLYCAVKPPHPDSSFSVPTQIPNTGGSPLFSPHVIDNDGNFRLVWDDGAMGDVFYMKKPADGDWSNPANISNTAGLSERPSLVLDTMGNLHLVWHDKTPGNFEVFYDMIP